MNSVYSAPRERRPLVEPYGVVIAGILLAGGWFGWYITPERYHLTGRQVAEFREDASLQTQHFFIVVGSKLEVPLGDFW